MSQRRGLNLLDPTFVLAPPVHSAAVTPHVSSVMQKALYTAIAVLRSLHTHYMSTYLLHVLL